MKTVVQALAQTLKSLDDWDGPIDADGIVKILEDIGPTLRRATPAEMDALRASLQQLAEEEVASADRWGMAAFYRDFLYTVGIDEEPPSAV